MTNQLVERGYLTQSLGSASHSGEHGFKTVPGLLKLVLKERAWEKRLIVETGEEFVGFPSFEAYINANPPKGLGTSIETLEKLIGNDTQLYQDFHTALRRPVGKPAGYVPHDTNITNTVDNINNNSNNRPTGTSKAYALQKLSDEGQVELLNQVKAGKISAHAAMEKAGFRLPRIAIRLDDAQAAAKTLLTHASPEFLDELRRLLNQGEQL